MSLIPAALAQRLAALRGLAPAPTTYPLEAFERGTRQLGEDDVNEVMSYSGPVFDMVMGTEVPLQEYLAEDPDNIVILIFDETQDRPTRAVGYPRSQLRASYDDMSAIRYKCRANLAGAPRPQDLDMTRPYYRISAPEPYLALASGLEDLFETTHRTFLLRKGFGGILPHTASRAVIMADPTTNTNLEGEDVSIVSADHCGPDTNAQTVEIYPVNLESTGGKRRRKNKKTQKKTKRRRMTRRRRNI